MDGNFGDADRDGSSNGDLDPHHIVNELERAGREYAEVNAPGKLVEEHRPIVLATVVM